MKLVILFITLAVAVATNCFADPNTPKITSDEYEFYIRVSPSYKMAEDELRSVYNELFKKLSPEEREDLKRSQLNWMRSRDERAFEVAPKGSEDYIRALIKITDERIRELNAILETRSSQSGKSLQTARYRAPEKTTSGIDFTALFSDKPVGYIDVWPITYEEQEKIWRMTGVCKKIKKEKEGGKEFAKCYRTIKDKSSGEIIQTGVTIDSAARGNFTGKGYNEIVLDVSEDHKSHPELYGSMYFIRDGKIVAQFDRLGEFIHLFASVKTKNGTTKLIALPTVGFSGTRDYSLKLCKFVEKTSKKYDYNCEKLLLTMCNLHPNEKGYIKCSYVEDHQVIDINGDGIKDIRIKVGYDFYKVEDSNEDEQTLIAGKTFIAEFVFTGETFEPTQRTKIKLEEWKKIENEISDKK